MSTKYGLAAFLAAAAVTGVLILTFVLSGDDAELPGDAAELPTFLRPRHGSRLKQQLLENAEERFAERWAWLNASLGYEADAFQSMSIYKGQAVSLLLSPHYPCLWSLDKAPSARQVVDGGKWTCGVAEMARRPKSSHCVIYSMGSNFNTHFEERMRALSKGTCEIHIFDPTISPANDSKFATEWHFHPWGLANESGIVSLQGPSVQAGDKFQVFTLQDIMSQLSHKYVDILKVDIEEAEWAFVPSLNWSQVPVGQLLLEIHDAQAALQLPELLDFMDNLHEAGYLIFASEPVCASCSGQYEVALIHHSWSPFKPPPAEGYKGSKLRLSPWDARHT